MTANPSGSGSPAPIAAKEYEKSVLGGMLVDPSTVPLVARALQPEDFFLEHNRRVFRALLRLQERGRPIDPAVLHQELQDSGDLEIAGGVPYLAELYEAVPSAAHVHEWIRGIREKGLQRRIAELVGNPRPTHGGWLTSLGSQLDQLASLDQRGEDRFRLLDDAEVESLPPQRYLVDGVVPENGLAVIYGAPGGGKTFLALDISFSVAVGREWFGHATRSGGVVYVFAEGVGGLPGRVKAWKLARHYVGSRLGVHFLPAPIALIEDSDVSGLLRSIRALAEPPKLVVFDTLARCFGGGDENSTETMNRAIRAVDRIRHDTGAAVMLIHHTNATGERERGNTALRGAADAMIQVKGEDGRVSIICDKSKDSAHFRRIELRQVEVGSSVVLDGADGALHQSPDELTSSQSDSLRSLHSTALTEGATATEWQTVAEGDGVKKRTFYEARKVLLDKGLVTRDKEGKGARYRLTENGLAIVGARCSDGAVDGACTNGRKVRAGAGGLETPHQCTDATDGGDDELVVNSILGESDA